MTVATAPAPLRSDSLGEWRLGWRVVLTGLVGMAAQSVGFMSLGTLLTEIVSDTGWSRTEVVGVGAAVAILCFFLSPVVGILLDRFGARRLALVGALLYPGALASVGLVGTAVWQWWLAWLAVGIAIQFINPMVWSYGVTRLFVHRRGFALGLTLSGVGVANAAVPLLIVSMLDHMSWRAIFPWLASGLAAVLLPLIIFCYRDTPDRAAGEGAPEALGLSPRETFRSTRYWRLSLAVLILAAAVGIINIHLQPILIDAGSTPFMAAVIASSFGPAQIIGRLLGGFLLDRFSGALVGCLMFLAPAVSLIMILSGVTSGPFAYAVPIFAGLAAGVEIDVAAYLASRYFGTRSYGTIFSVIYGFHAVGYALSPTIAAGVRDASGSYMPILLGMLCLIPLASVFVGTLGKYPDFGARRPNAGKVSEDSFA